MVTSALVALRWTDILPKFDPRSRPVYLLLVVLGAVTISSLAYTGIDVSRAFNPNVLYLGSFLIFVSTMLRRAGRDQWGTFIETLTLLFGHGGIIAALQFPLATAPFPFADVAFNQIDRALGFDWLSFANLFSAPRMLSFLDWAYRSMTWQSAVVLGLLSIRGMTDRAWQFVTAAILVFAVAVLLFPLFPVDGTFALCGLRPANIPVFPSFCDYGPILHHLKDGSLRTLDPSMRVGLVSFPSAHAGAGFLLVWAVWPFPQLRWPSVVLNGALMVGAIVIGGHYLIDVIGGALIACAAATVVSRCVIVRG